MKVMLATADTDLHRIAPVMLQLRPQYETLEKLVQQIKLQQQQGYQLAYVEDNDEVLCVAGFVIGSKLAWQKHLYVDDLVTSETHRSTGAGKCIIEWLREYAKQHACQQLHLDSSVQRFGAHKFYLREGFTIKSHHFVIDEL